MSESQPLPEDPKLRALYRAGRNEQPSEALDQSVLAKAHHAAARRRNRWIVPLSSAALVLLGVSLTLPLIEPPEPLLELEEAGPGSRPQRPVGEMDRSLQKSLAPPAPAGVRLAPMPKEKLERRRSTQGEDDEAASADFRAMKRMPPASFAEAPPADAQPRLEEPAELTPEAWLEKIEKLFGSNQHQAARESLAEFRARYPDYPLPESLQQRLEGR